MSAIRKHGDSLLLSLLLLGGCGVSDMAWAVQAETYSSPDAWLCRPGQQDLCASDQRSTSCQTLIEDRAGKLSAAPTN